MDGSGAILRAWADWFPTANTNTSYQPNWTSHASIGCPLNEFHAAHSNFEELQQTLAYQKDLLRVTESRPPLVIAYHQIPYSGSGKTKRYDVHIHLVTSNSSSPRDGMVYPTFPAKIAR